MSDGGGGRRQDWMRFLCHSFCPLRLGRERAGTGEERKKKRERAGFWEVNTGDYDQTKIRR